MPSAAQRPWPVKVVVTGPWGSGKTTFIKSLSEISVLSTQRSVGDQIDAAGGEGTVAMDFGRMTVGDGLSLHLFGTPGRDRFDFMWGVVNDGLLGVIVLLDDARAGSTDEAMSMLTYFRERATVTYVVAVNKVAPAQADRATRRARHNLRIPEHVRVVAVDVRNRESAKRVMLELLYAASEDAHATPDARTA